jgi:glycerol uptake facilitator-like aquaporin
MSDNCCDSCLCANVRRACQSVLHICVNDIWPISLFSRYFIIRAAASNLPLGSFVGVGYIAIELLGSCLASVLAPLLFQDQSSLTTHYVWAYPYDIASKLVLHKSPLFSATSAVYMELILTFTLIFLVFVICFDPLSFTASRSLLCKVLRISTPTKKQDHSKEMKDSSEELTTPQSSFEEWFPEEKNNQPSPDMNILAGSALAGIQKSVNDSTMENKRVMIAMSVGIIVAFLIWMGTSLSGCVFNPARALGPGNRRLLMELRLLCHYILL